MSYKKVTDHVDILSSQLWKQLLNDLINRCRYHSYLNPSLNDIANILSTLPIPTSGKPIKPSLYNNMANACKELARSLNKTIPSGLRTVSSGDWVFASDINALIDCLNEIPPPQYNVYTIDTNDWNTAKQYITGYTIIFLEHYIDTVTSDEILNLVKNYPVVIAVKIRNQYRNPRNTPAFYPIFYTNPTPRTCAYCISQFRNNYCKWNVIDNCLRENLLPSIYATRWDDFLYIDDKVSDAVYYIQFITCNYSYKKYGYGAIIEVPGEGVWINSDWFSRYVLGLSKCFLGVDKPYTVIYLGEYTTIHPEQHECYTAFNCIKDFASRYGYNLIDLRTPPIPPETPPIKPIYLFTTNDWNTARNYVTENSMIFVNYDIDTLSNTELANLVNNRRVIVVNMIDWQPFYQKNAPAFYQIFYNTLNPQGYNCATYDILEPAFEEYRNANFYGIDDNIISSDYKVTGVVNYAECISARSLKYGYKIFNKGVIIEAPYDGVWINSYWTETYVYTYAYRFFGTPYPDAILYLAGYTSSNPSEHGCYPADTCWFQFASRNWYQIYDLRR